MATRDQAERTSAERWLRTFLAAGRRPVRDVYRAALAAGVDWDWIMEIRRGIGVTPGAMVVSGKREWAWGLPVKRRVILVRRRPCAPVARPASARPASQSQDKGAKR